MTGLLLVPLLAGALGATTLGAADTLRLGELHAAAVAGDPRGRQLELLAAGSALRLESLAAERLPSLSVLGEARYQSEVATLPIRLPGGVSPPVPPKDAYDAHLAARQRLHDPTLGPRREVERARTAESRSAVRAALYPLREGVNEAFFGALLLESRGSEVAAGIADLEARLRVAEAREREGAALPSEPAALEAELLRRRQMLAELEAGAESARAVLGDLIGRPVGQADVLALPDLGAAVGRARAALGSLRERPEYERFARGRELLDRRSEAVSAAEAPRLSAFGRAGYGRPGLNPLASEFGAYWLGGVQVEWSPWRWGAGDRERAELALQREILASEEAAFTASLRRATVGDLAAIDRLERALGDDDRIVALRETILRETAVRYAENVVTSAELIDRETDLLEARVARATHRVELARARARFLTLLGLELP